MVLPRRSSDLREKQYAAAVYREVRRGGVAICSSVTNPSRGCPPTRPPSRCRKRSRCGVPILPPSRGSAGATGWRTSTLSPTSATISARANHCPASRPDRKRTSLNSTHYTHYILPTSSLQQHKYTILH